MDWQNKWTEVFSLHGTITVSEACVARLQTTEPEFYYEVYTSITIL